MHNQEISCSIVLFHSQPWLSLSNIIEFISDSALLGRMIILSFVEAKVRLASFARQYVPWTASNETIRVHSGA